MSIRAIQWAFCAGAILAQVLAGSEPQNGSSPLTSVPSGSANTVVGAIDRTSGDAPALYRLGSGDVLDVKVFGRPQLTTESVRIDENGDIRLPMISTPIRAACRTEAELIGAITADYSEYLVNPQVTVTIRQYSSQTVNFVGAVQRPGSFQLERRVRLRELVALAGGLSATAGDTILVVNDEQRAACGAQSNDRRAPVSLINTRMMLAGQESANPYVMPGDFINANEAAQAFVVGNVYKPGPVSLAQPVTLTRALAMAGGRLPGSRSDIHIVRRAGTDQANITVLTFDIKAILSNKQEDPLLKPGDVVEVDISITKALAKTFASSIASWGAIYYPLTFIK